MNAKHIDILLKNIPDEAGVYKFINKDDIVIYVGKAKNLKKRVNSYFNKIHDSARTRILVKNTTDIQFIIVKTEQDALLLENSLIKELQPKYNIRLKDDKTYPYLCIKKEAFPRVFLTRTIIKDGSEYYGPYSNVRQVKVLLDTIKEIHKIRSCNYNLSENNIKEKKYHVCLEYHIKNCLGACEDLQKEEDYSQTISSVKNIIKGDFKSSLKYLEDMMMKFSKELKFELAQDIKDRIDVLKNYQSKSTVVSQSINNVDVFAVISDPDYGYVNYLKIINGAIINSYTLEIKKCLEESDKEILEYAIPEIREIFKSESREIILPFEIDYKLPNVNITVPKIGDRKALLDLSEKNAQYFKLENLKKIKILNPEKHTNRLMEQMKRDLNLSEEPRWIECFDNSNIQGSDPVASCVVFKDGKPSKKDYRHFNIKTTEGRPDDFASMEEIVYRRYKRLLEENHPLPNLIVIDGGKGQLSSAVNSLKKLHLYGKVNIISIAKRLEEIYYPEDSIPLHLNKKSETLKVIQHIRNESHRFAITHHREKRNKGTLHSELTEIAGIGNITAMKLLKKFKSIDKIKTLNLHILTEFLDKRKAEILYNYFNNKK